MNIIRIGVTFLSDAFVNKNILRSVPTILFLIVYNMKGQFICMSVRLSQPCAYCNEFREYDGMRYRRATDNIAAALLAHSKNSQNLIMFSMQTTLFDQGIRQFGRETRVHIPECPGAGKSARWLVVHNILLFCTETGYVYISMYTQLHIPARYTGTNSVFTDCFHVLGVRASCMHSRV